MKSDKNIREGYKKTAVGVIPEEWEVKKLKELVTIQNGRGYSHLEKGDIPVYASGGIINYVNKPLYEGTSIGIGRKGTIDSPQLLTGKYWVIDTLFFMNDFKDVYPYFLYSKFQEVNWYRYNETSGLPSLIKNTIQKVQFAIPPLPEQQAIANCLTTWDSGIEKLTQLIAAKREQKKGLMQQLLTGKKRLDGFVGEWKEVKIGKLGETFNGLTGKTKKDFGEGKPYVTYLNTFRQNCIDENTSFDYVKINDNENQSTLKYGDLIFTTSSETPNEVGMSSVILFHPKDSLYLNSFCFGLRLENFETLHPSFATFMLRGNDFRREMYKLAQGSTRFNLSKASFKKITVKLPPIEEQTAIAHILTTADKEIELLEKKLEAMKEEKKGLMQVLLTGKKRLIDS